MTTPVETVTLGINTTTGATTGTFAFNAGIHYEIHVAFTGDNIPSNSQTVEITGDAIAGRISLTSLAVTDSAYADAYLVANGSADTTLFYQQCANPGSTLKTIPYYLQIKVDGVIRWQIAGTATGSMVKGKTIAQPPFDFTAAADLAKASSDEAIAAAAEAMQSATDAETAAASAATSAGNAAQSATEAQSSATEAEQSAEDAANSAANAYDSETAANASAESSAASAESSQSSATASQTSADKSAASATTSAQYATISTQQAQAAAQSVIDATQQADRSQNYAEAAYASAAEAEQAAASILSIPLNTTAPLQGGGLLGTPLTLFMPPASATQDGYITKEKWAEIGTGGGGVVTAVTQANGLTLTGGTLALGLASTSANGALSSTDWNTFNSKQAGLGYTPANIDQSIPQTLLGTWAFPQASVANYVQYGLTPTIPSTIPVGMTFWNADAKCLSYGVDGGSIEIGQEMYVNCTNMEDFDMVDGDIVSVVGVTGNRLAVKLTDSTNAVSARACIGMVTQGGAKNQLVRVTTFGLVHNLNLAGLTEGVPCYVDPANPGKITQTQPNAPYYTIALGVVMNAHATQGVFGVRVIWIPSFNDLSDVNGTALTTDGQIAVWDQTHKYFDFTKNINDYLTTSAAGSTYLKLDQSTAQTLTASPKITGLTSGQVVVAGANGILTSGTGLTFASELLTLTGTTNVVHLKIQGLAGQANDVAQFGNISGGAFLGIGINGTISIAGGTTTGITDILVNPAAKTSGNFFDFQINGTSKIKGNYAGEFFCASLYVNGLYSGTSTTGFTCYPFQNGNLTGTGNSTAFKLFGGTQENRRTTGTQIGLGIYPVYNQATGTASNTDFKSYRTETAIGSGTQLLFDFGVGTTSKAKCDNTGHAIFASSVAVGADATAASSDNVGSIRYYVSGNNSYCDMCMQTGASTYAWVNIKTNSW